MIQFGEAPTGPVRERIGAYAIVVNEAWRVAIVRIGAGIHLPGGGANPGESPIEAMHREVAEETGMTVEVVSSLGTARQYVAWQGTMWNKIGHFFVCRPLSFGVATEPDHTLEWWGGDRARTGLSHAYYGWAVRRALSSC